MFLYKLNIVQQLGERELIARNDFKNWRLQNIQSNALLLDS